MAAPVALPPQFGRYRIVQTLGAGGMGSVYLAEDTLLGRKVAVKVPHFSADDGPLVLERFLREARAAAALDHPNLCQVFDTGEVNGVHYLVMPYIDGTPLSRLVDEEHPWPPDKAVALVKQLAAALQVLHERGLIHRDLKPSNVMIRASGEPVIMDFGLARSLAQQSRQLTQMGSMVGTPAFMAPEQVNGDLKALGPATDVYALGVILYELLTGHLPFEGAPAVVFGQILNAAPEAPSVRRAGVAAWMDWACLEALAKKPAERHASMTAFARELEAPVPLPPTMLTTVPAARKTNPPPAGMPTQYAPLARSITCSQCGKKLKAPSSFSGERLRCPGCRADLTDAVQAAHETPSPAVLPDFTQRDRALTPSRPRRGLWIIAIGVLAICALLGWAILGPRGRNEEREQIAWERELLARERMLAREREMSKPPEKSDPFPQLSKDITNSIGMKFVRIPAGKFLMGSPMEEKNRSSDEVQHEVEITKPFYLGVHEVTQGQYERVMDTNPSYFSATGAGKEKVKGMDTRRFPVEQVSWEDAVKFCAKLSEMPEEKQAGRSYRLPTEAEWEYSCRGGANSSKPFHFGDSLSSKQANFDGTVPYGGAPKGEYLQRPCDVGSYPANAFGLHDMHGNVWEWCQDWYGPYDDTVAKDPKGPATDKDNRRVLRGGSWYFDGWYCRSAIRYWFVPGSRLSLIGFRVLCVVRTP